MTPVWATTHECQNSCGSKTSYSLEVAIMATTPLRTCPKNLHPIFCKRVYSTRPAIIAKFARISRHLTQRQRVSLLKIGGVA
ncbi:ash family protein [Arsenophonus nasoniae]|uniref:ash family protein n=1 Tax=Arsenophonus nasoniae TaxID=638 RepID=UPI003CC81809